MNSIVFNVCVCFDLKKEVRENRIWEQLVCHSPEQRHKTLGVPIPIGTVQLHPL
jgi:hypothetical protein